MELQGALTINGKEYRKGDQIPWYVVYPFFLLHQLLLDATRARSNAARRQLVDALYVGGSVMLYGSIWLVWR